jgi:hypothetical protein
MDQLQNRTNEERLAIQISTIPKDQNLITVIEERKGIFDYAKSFNIDEDYFTEENVCNSPSDKYPVIKEEERLTTIIPKRISWN